MGKNITMRDVAREMGVSTVTVSKALSNREGVSDEVRKKIKEKAEEMGYRYNALAKGMKEGVSYNVGILVSDRFFEDNSFYANLYRLLVLKLSKYNYCGILEIITEEQEKEFILPNSVLNSKIDGMIILGQISKAYIQEVTNCNIPHLYLDFYTDAQQVETIVGDNVFGSYCLTNYLLEMGHEKIGFVGKITATSSIMDRYLGTLKGLLQAGLTLPEEWIITDRDDRGKFIELELPKKMPTAFVCNCDEVAYSLIKKLKENGYRVPEDISVVGFDDYIYAVLSDPKLTTFKVDMEQMVNAAVSSIVKKIDNPNYIMGRRVVCGTIVVRDSVKKIKNKEGMDSFL